MKIVVLPVLLALGLVAAEASDRIPSELVGEWASKTAPGFTLSVCTNGTAAILQSPPPIAAKGRAIYDATNHVLRVTFDPRPREGLTNTVTSDFIYDPKGKTLTPEAGASKDALKRIRERIPDL